MKLTNTTLKKLEEVLSDLGYEVIYGKGQFQSGKCLVEEENKIVINKFYSIESRIQILLEIISQQQWEDIVDNQPLRTFILQKTQVDQ